MAGLFPVIAPFERALGVDQDVGDVLDITDLVHAPPDFKERIVARRADVGRIEQEAVREALPPAGRQVPVLAFRSEEHTSELQSVMRISYAVFCLKKNTQTTKRHC